MKHAFLRAGAVVALCSAPALASGVDIHAPATLEVRPGLVVDLATGATTSTPHPIPEALRQAERGDVIQLEPGTYPGFLMGLNNPHRQDNVFDGVQGVVLRARIPGSAVIDTGGSDTILIQQPVEGPRFRDISFVGLRIHTGTDAGVRFGKAGRYWGFHFHDVHITGNGRYALWGVRIYSGGNILFDDCLIEDIPVEHGIYASNNVGNFTVRNSTIRNVGRAAIQFREVTHSEAPDVIPSQGRTRIVNNRFVNPGRNDGASAITLRGTHIVDLVDNIFISGFGAAHNSRGGVVASGVPLYGKPFANHCLTMVRNRFMWRNPDRAVVALSSTNNVKLRHNLLATDSYVHPALDLSVPGGGPPNRRTAIVGTEFGRGRMEARIKVRRFGSQVLTDAQIADLAPAADFAWRCGD